MIILRLLRLEMQVHALGFGMIEHDIPLSCFATVKSIPIFRCRVVHIWKHIVIVASNIHGQKGNGVHAIVGEVVDGTQDAMTLCSVSPQVVEVGGVVEILDVRSPCFGTIAMIGSIV